MTIILFLIDTSASMCQKVHVNGVQKTYLDVAKGAVETFLKFRQRSADCMGDRYMLLTFEEPPSNVKAGWKENHATFMNELKNLQSNGLTCMGEALKNGFDLLNLNRMQSGIDTYGQGRCPFYLETSVIIVITDGGKYSFRNGVHNEIVLPLHAQIPGTKLTKEPFRWDQRLFSLVLRMAGHRVDERIDVKVPHDDSPIEKMCEVTGGRSYKIRSHYVLNHCIESLVQKVQPGVVVQFDQPLPMLLKPDALHLPGKDPAAAAIEVPDLVFPTTKKMIYVPKNMPTKNYPIGYWPLPEPYWPDPKAVQLPPRDAHPRIRVISPCVDEPVPVRNFPVDKYELEGSPLTMQILARRELNRCWPVVVVNSGGGVPVVVVPGMPMPQPPPPHELPFGYLKANNTFTQVYLVVLPLNYPVLLPLLHDLFHRYMNNPPNDWVYKFSNYVRSIPQYYCPFLRRALAAISVPYQLLGYIIPENLDSYLSQPVANHLKALKNAAKQDLEALCMRIFKQMKQPRPPHRQVETAKLMPMSVNPPPIGIVGPQQLQQQQLGQQNPNQSQQPPPTQQQQAASAFRKEMVSHPMLRDTFAKIHSDCQVYDNYTVVVPVATIRGQLTGSAPVTHATSGGVVNGGIGVGVGIAGRASRNPFDIRRRDLVDEIARMRENFFKMVGPSGGLAMAGSGGGGVGAAIQGGASAVNGAAGHCLPISEMGNYQEYLKNKETPLREIEPTHVRQHMFGNPYKKDKHMVMVDEADMVGDVSPMMKSGGNQSPGMGSGGAGPGGGGGGNQMMMMSKKRDVGGVGLAKTGGKRKPGPISREFKFRRLSTSSCSSVDSYGSSSGGSECGSESGGSSMVSDDFDDDEKPLVMDLEEAEGTGGGGGGGSGISSVDVAEGLAESAQVEGERNGEDQSRINGSGGSSTREHREEEVQDRLISPSSSSPVNVPVPATTTTTTTTVTTIVLTPSEGVLSPMYHQPPPTPSTPSIVTQAQPSDRPGIGGSLSISPTSALPSPSLPAAPSNLLGPSAESRKQLSNGSGTAILERSPSITGTSSSSSSSSSLSNFNDADEISKILQQSCSQHNGSSSAQEQEGSKKKSRTHTESSLMDDDDDNHKVTAGPTTSTSGGRKRRQMSKQASAELLEVVAADNEEESTTTSLGSNRRHSPRMVGVSSGKANSSSSSSSSSLLNDRLTGGRVMKEEEVEVESQTTNHVVKSSWSSRKKEKSSNNNHSSHSNLKQKEENDDDDGATTTIFDGGWGSNNGESLQVIREANYEARTVLFHDIRRPGRDYSQLLEHLELIRGDFETRFAFIQMCIAEAMRFHRKKMATTIQEWWDQKIDRITTKGSNTSPSGGGGGGRGTGPEPEPSTESNNSGSSSSSSGNNKGVATKGGGQSGSGTGTGRQRGVKLRSVTGSAVTPSKC